ncbi:MetQ/NlpA family ABC transporter substrate-binding protein [Campylobacter avium]|uniref:MetQ/NlpA family ABC transporter substrate-binding protein n=1 Tax=Campylobacter avium TaxID=522485 RepID=UPI0023545A99|nr:MetQ/NlpA family ABC transporter substrate-binding protein [Campylobacter avium]
MKKILLLSALLLSFSFANTLKVGASITPHAEILHFVKDKLKSEGIDLQIFEISDDVINNSKVDSGELDANYFQHEPFLLEFNKAKGTKLVKVASIHIEPMGVYSSKHKSFEPKDRAIISIPNDPTNESRALRIVESAGLIKLNDKEFVTPLDIVQNPKNLKFIELKDAQLPRSLSDVDYSLINSNFALQAGLSPSKDSLYTENKYSNYANIVAVKKGKENDPKVLALIKALQSDDVKEFLKEKYKGAVIPAF